MFPLDTVYRVVRGFSKCEGSPCHIVAASSMTAATHFSVTCPCPWQRVPLLPPPRWRKAVTTLLGTARTAVMLVQSS